MSHFKQPCRISAIALLPGADGLRVGDLRETWPAIEAAVAQACAGLKADLLTKLAALEDGLVERPLLQRVQEA